MIAGTIALVAIVEIRTTASVTFNVENTWRQTLSLDVTIAMPTLKLSALDD